MRRPLGDVCLDIASFARERKHEFLSYILRLAAAEAYKNADEDDAFELPVQRKQIASELIVGIWDWDIQNGRTHLDAACARLFNVDAAHGARGLSNELCIKALHPDDTARVQAAIASAVRLGGPYECEYRVIQNDRIRWVLARGSCTLDRAGRAVRFPGVLIDITHDKTMH